MGGYSVARRLMVKQLLARGITSSPVLAAMSSVLRHQFIEPVMWPRAYEDSPISIGSGQTISQPYIVALMSQLLEVSPGMKVLEIGTGSGYQAAVLDKMDLEVYSVERLTELYQKTSRLLLILGYGRIQLKIGDGTLGWKDKAPFDRIIVTAGGPDIPAPLIDQLADPGIMVIPAGNAKREQELFVIYKQNGEIITKSHGSVAFVDLVGDHGW